MLKELLKVREVIEKYPMSPETWFGDSGMDEEATIFTCYGDKNVSYLSDSETFAENVSSINDLFTRHCEQIKTVLGMHKGERCLVRASPCIQADENRITLYTRLYFGKPNVN